MKYAIQYNRDFRHFDTVDEVIFNYKGTELLVDIIPEILKKDEQRAVIDITKIEKEKISEVIVNINKLKEIHSNIVIIINYNYQKDLISLLEDNNIKFMFSKFAKGKDDFYNMTQFNISDIYIVEELAFYMEDLQYIRQEKKINIRLFPNIAQWAGSGSSTFPEITKFFIRPEDVELYEEYIDVLEIMPDNFGKKSSVVYEIYKQEQWLGTLGQLIGDLNLDIENTNIAPEFGQIRLNCGKRCAFGQCNLCTKIEDLSKDFNNAEIAIVKERKPLITEKEKEQIEKEIKNGFQTT